MVFVVLVMVIVMIFLGIGLVKGVGMIGEVVVVLIIS